MKRRAMTLAECVVAMLLVSGVLVAALQAAGAARTAHDRAADWLLADQLAHGLLAEITTRAFAESADADTPLGPDGGETARSAYDDVDDYHGLLEAPPRDGGGAAVAGAGWTRSVTVEYVVGAKSLVETSVAATDVKRITVTLSRDGRELARIVSFRARHWPDAILPTGD